MPVLLPTANDFFNMSLSFKYNVVVYKVLIVLREKYLKSFQMKKITVTTNLQIY